MDHRRGIRLRLAIALMSAILPWAAHAETDPPPLPDTSIEAFVVVGAAGTLEFPPGTADRRLPAVLILHDGGEADTRSAVYAAQITGAGLAVLDLLTQEDDGVTAALAALAAHPRVAGQMIGVLGFGAGARQAARLPATIQARALLYPGCTNWPATYTGHGAVLLLSGEADETNTPEACGRAAEQLAAGGATVRWISYPHATYAWDFPSYGFGGPLRILTADAAGRVVAQPWPELAGLSAGQVAGFFAAQFQRAAQ